MSLKEDLLGIERTLWRNDAKAYSDAFLESAVIMFPQIGRMSLSQALAAIREENKSGKCWESVDFEQVSVDLATDDAALLTYHARARWNDGSEEASFCGTLYVRRSDAWRVIYHQQSPAA